MFLTICSFLARFKTYSVTAFFNCIIVQPNTFGFCIQTGCKKEKLVRSQRMKTRVYAIHLGSWALFLGTYFTALWYGQSPRRLRESRSRWASVQANHQSWFHPRRSITLSERGSFARTDHQTALVSAATWGASRCIAWPAVALRVEVQILVIDEGVVLSRRDWPGDAEGIYSWALLVLWPFLLFLLVLNLRFIDRATVNLYRYSYSYIYETTCLLVVNPFLFAVLIRRWFFFFPRFFSCATLVLAVYF